MGVTIPFLRTCRLKIRVPIRLIQHPTFSVYASLISATVLPGNPSDGIRARPCRHTMLLRIRRSLGRDQSRSALAKLVMHPTRSATKSSLCARRIARLVVPDPDWCPFCAHSLPWSTTWRTNFCPVGMHRYKVAESPRLFTPDYLWYNILRYAVSFIHPRALCRPQLTLIQLQRIVWMHDAKVLTTARPP